MKKFLTENWFNLGILAIAVFAILSYSSFLKEKNDLEEKKFLSEALENQQKQQQEIVGHVQKSNQEDLINKCITDAYVELKTLQGGYDSLRSISCSKNPDYCSNSIDYWNDAKSKAFTTYKEEWVPQCKLGNRVFIHYEPVQNN